MGQIINMLDVIKKQKPPKEPLGLSGIAQCMVCFNTWEVLGAAVGTIWLRCPVCDSEKGHFKYPCAKTDTQEWICNCDNTLFRVYLEGVFCPHCGKWQEGF
jgi:hypothetical protein